MRIVALSDQHGFLPEIPPCDLAILAGDICPDRIGPFYAMREPHHQKAWFDANVRPWLADAPATHKVATWGNHDWCGQACDFSRDSPANASTHDLQILVDESTTVSSLTIWATPWSNRFMTWAFMKTPAEIATIYEEIPEGIDILISHQPPRGYGDRFLGSGTVEHLGSHELLATIDRVQPKLVICGHFHEGYGREEYRGIPIYNVAVVNEQYRLVKPATVIDFP
jgi:Icc-related predicted phosphoesterase